MEDKLAIKEELIARAINPKFYRVIKFFKIYEKIL